MYMYSTDYGVLFVYIIRNISRFSMVVDLDEVLFAFCGQLQETPLTIISRENVVQILFFSNDQGEYPGFSMTYQAIEGSHHYI